MTRSCIIAAVAVGCQHAPDASPPDASPIVDATDTTPRKLGTVSDGGSVTCPSDAAPGSTCSHVTVAGCPDLESQALGATIAILDPSAPLAGTLVHLIGGGGEGILVKGADTYASDGLRQVWVSWDTDWEQTSAQGIKAAACRPATIVKWVFDTIHDASRTLAFCGEGKSGGSGQFGYALAHYGLGDYLDYVNEWAGPPFARIDLGCNGDAPQTETVCGDPVKTALPPELTAWENMAPQMCGGTQIPAADLARWSADSIAVGGTYLYPNTEVQFWVCTNDAPAVTAMSKYYYDAIAAADPTRVGYHCYKQSDGCRGEGLGDAGDAAREQAMRDGCRPRHQP